MYSASVEVEFVTDNPREVPQVGSRKRLRVNGRVETLYANRVEVERRACYPEGYEYRGTVLYSAYDDV